MENTQIKIAVCFFGLTRSLKHTYPSIQKNIFKVLERHNIKYDIFLHTYDLNTLSNKRSGETCCTLDTDEWKLLKPTEHKITNQQSFDESFHWDMLFKHGDIWKDGFKSVKNAIRQLNSLKQVTSLWIDKPPYDYYIYIRPDLYYVNEINVNDILEHLHLNNILVIPYWGNYRGGFNDRIAYGSYNVMKTYGMRIQFLNKFFKNSKVKKPYHSERYLTKVIREHQIFIRFCKLRGIRVRANLNYDEKDSSMFMRYLT
tara:strand:+ start:5723 stop:6493 length:771 start_codon:yes stop_codon:yes gene_type:complete